MALLITSLALIILDPDARTLHGFEALVEREWIQTGHPFWTRWCMVDLSGLKSIPGYNRRSNLINFQEWFQPWRRPEPCGPCLPIVPRLCLPDPHSVPLLL